MLKFLQRRRRDAAIAACQVETLRTEKADARSVITPRDAATRTALLETARRENATDAETVRQLQSLHRLLTLYQTNTTDVVEMDAALIEARALNLGETSAARMIDAVRALAVVQTRGLEVIETDSAGRRIYYRGLVGFKNEDGVLEIRDDGITFIGEVRIDIVWNNVVHVAEVLHDSRDLLCSALVIQERKRRTATKFLCSHDLVESFPPKVAIAAWQEFRTRAPEAASEPTSEGPSTSEVPKPQGSGSPPADLPVVSLPGTGRGYFCPVVGESFYQDALRTLQGTHLTVRLTAEPDNPHDPNAVAVQSLKGATLGYFPHEEAARYQQLVLQLSEKGLVPSCRAQRTGGTSEKGSIGLVLDLEAPTIIARALGLRYTRRRRSGPAETDAGESPQPGSRST